MRELTLTGRGVRIDIQNDMVEVSTGTRMVAFTPEQWEWLAMVAGPSVVIGLRRPPENGHSGPPTEEESNA